MTNHFKGIFAVNQLIIMGGILYWVSCLVCKSPVVVPMRKKRAQSPLETFPKSLKKFFCITIYSDSIYHHPPPHLMNIEFYTQRAQKNRINSSKKSPHLNILVRDSRTWNYFRLLRILFLPQVCTHMLDRVFQWLALMMVVLPFQDCNKRTILGRLEWGDYWSETVFVHDKYCNGNITLLLFN